jgi:hypothetical protein
MLCLSYLWQDLEQYIASVLRDARKSASASDRLMVQQLRAQVLRAKYQLISMLACIDGVQGGDTPVVFRDASA